MFRNDDIYIKDNILYLREPRVRIPFQYIKTVLVENYKFKDKITITATTGHQYHMLTEIKETIEIIKLLTK